jgi:hypothetical protein
MYSKCLNHNNIHRLHICHYHNNNQIPEEKKQEKPMKVNGRQSKTDNNFITELYFAH